MTKEWTEYLEILSEMKTTADVQKAYMDQGNSFMKVLSMGGNKNTAPYTLPRPPRASQDSDQWKRQRMSFQRLKKI
jgi:hypothetical protein